MTWAFRYASHLGYRTPRPLYQESAASPDPVDQIEFAASLGFAGVQYAQAARRTPEERARVRKALDRYGLETGCMIYADAETMVKPLWGTLEAGAAELRSAALHNAFEVAAEVGSRHVAIFSGADPQVPTALQNAAFTENLKRAAELAAKRGIVLYLENISRRARTGMLVTHLAEAYAIVKAVDSDAWRLIFDTSHVQIMDGDVIENLRATWDAVAVVQIADNPGRLEPGKGELNIENVLRVVKELGYDGLLELEHDWSEPTRACEEAGLAYLRELDARLAEVAAR